VISALFVGLTEAWTKEQSPDVRVERFPWVANGKAVGKEIALSESRGGLLNRPQRAQRRLLRLGDR
jgi:hypothetical protein